MTPRFGGKATGRFRRRYIRASVVWLMMVSMLFGTIGPALAQAPTDVPGITIPGRVDASLPGYRLVCTQAYQGRARSHSGPDVISDANTQPATPGEVSPAKPLKNSTPLGDGLGSGAYMSSVGGMAFGKTALPRKGSRLSIDKLMYSRKDPDGQRLRVVIDGRSHVVRGLPDWQLVPIVEYADSPYLAVVTLFGELRDGKKKPTGARYVVNFHPALEGTLLGLRLFQADFMLLDPTTTGELPRFHGKYLLGVNEEEPRMTLWQRASMELNQVLGRHDRARSYVICDHERDIRFSADRGFSITGEPYFYYWNPGKEVLERVHEPGERPQMVRTHQVVHLPTLSEDMSSQSRLHAQVNPAVYNALLNTMRYAAFFRYCKRMNLDMWNGFVGSLDKVRVDTFTAPTPVFVFP